MERTMTYLERIQSTHQELKKKSDTIIENESCRQEIIRASRFVGIPRTVLLYNLSFAFSITSIVLLKISISFLLTCILLNYGAYFFLGMGVMSHIDLVSRSKQYLGDLQADGYSRRSN